MALKSTPSTGGGRPTCWPGAGAISSLSDQHADVAELVDAHGSGPCLGNQVEVRVLSSACSPAPSQSVRIVATVEDHEQRALDPEGRRVVFDAGSHLHLAEGRRSWLLDHI